MQGGQLHGYAVVLFGIGSSPGAANDVDGMGIGMEVSFGIGEGAGAFAQHVEREQGPRLVLRSAAAHGFVDRAAHHVLPTQNAHGLQNRPAHYGFAQSCNEAAHPVDRVVQCLRLKRHQAPCQHQPPHGSVDETRGRLAEMRIPVTGSNFLRDQRIGSRLVGDAQQRLRQAHQGDALAVGKAKLLQKDVEGSRLVGRRAALPHQVARAFQNGIALRGRQHAACFCG